MDTQNIIHRLNCFYTLELSQVDMYTRQSNHVDDICLSKTLARIAEIEQQYAENIASILRTFGQEPYRITDLAGTFLGTILATASGAASTVNLLKLDIALGEKAMRDYRDFILRAGGYPELFNILWSNLVDENLHTARFASKVEHLRGIRRPD